MKGMYKHRVTDQVVSAEQYREGQPLPAGVRSGSAGPFIDLPGRVAPLTDGDWVIDHGAGLLSVLSVDDFVTNYEPV